jgi:hypothetical protein
VRLGLDNARVNIAIYTVAQDAGFGCRWRSDNLNTGTGSAGMIRSIPIVLNLKELILTNRRSILAIAGVAGKSTSIDLIEKEEKS